MTLQQALSDLLQAVGVVLGVLATTYLPRVPGWINAHVKNKELATTLELVAKLAQWAVSDVEPASTDSASPSGSAKKAAAVAIVKAGLAKQDMTVTDAVVSGAVEKAVSDLHQAYGQTDTAVDTPINDHPLPEGTKVLSSEATAKLFGSQSQTPVSESTSQFHWGGDGNG